MKTIKLITAFICAMTLSVNVKPVFAQEGIEFDSEYKDGNVVYSFDKDETAITNGRIAVTYNEKEMKLVSVENANIFDVEDVNQLEATKEDGSKTLYFAFASANELIDKGNVLTLTFEVDASMKGKDVTLTTNVEEMYHGETSIEVEKDVDQVSIPNDPKTDGKGDNADTSDTFNVALYGSMMILAICGIGLVAFKKEKIKS